MGLFDRAVVSVEGTTPQTDTHVAFPDAEDYTVEYVYSLSTDGGSYPHVYEFKIKDTDGRVVVSGVDIDSTKKSALECAKDLARRKFREYMAEQQIPNQFTESFSSTDKEWTPDGNL